MKLINTVAKLFSSVSTLAIVASAVAFNSVAMGQVGKVTAWGCGAEQLPTNLGSCLQISPGNTSIALLANNTVMVWGDGEYGQMDVPSNLGTCSQIMNRNVDVSHVVVIQTNGTVRAWGDNRYGQCNVPPDLGPCKEIAAGAGGGINGFTLAIQNNGTVRAWGNNENGQCNVPSNLGPCIHISASQHGVLAIKSNGTVVGWGNGYDTPTDLGPCIQIVSGFSHNVAIQNNGTVRAWGYNEDGQCNVPPNLGPCTQIATGTWHTVALTTNGTVRTWGGTTSDIPQIEYSNKIAANWRCSFAIQGSPPTITGVLPVSGPSSGGTAVTISGTDFPSSSIVTIGGVLATNVVWLTPTKLTAVSPRGTPGVAAVAVNGVVSSEAFYYRPTCGSDLDNSGVVDSGDISIVLLDFGSCSDSAAVAPQQEPLILQTAEPAKSVPKKNN